MAVGKFVLNISGFQSEASTQQLYSVLEQFVPKVRGLCQKRDELEIYYPVLSVEQLLSICLYMVTSVMGGGVCDRCKW